MRLPFTHHLLVGMNEKCGRCIFFISKILKVFRSKLPIELERLGVCYPKNME